MNPEGTASARVTAAENVAVGRSSVLSACKSLSLKNVFNIYLLMWLHRVLVVTWDVWLQHVGSSSLTRDRTRACTCMGSTEGQETMGKMDPTEE